MSRGQGLGTRRPPPQVGNIGYPPTVSQLVALAMVAQATSIPTS